MSTTSTPLRYPGGKSRLSRYIDLVLTLNRLRGGNYVEPFAGGAGAAINLLLRGAVQSIYLNDIDRRITAFWTAVLFDAESLCRLVSEAPLTLEEWDRQRLILANANDYSDLEVAFAALFMNRTNHSGILSGGMIGGRKQNGKWRLDARFTRRTLIKKIKIISALSDKIIIYNLDADEFLQDVVAKLDGPTLAYLDPPYYKKGQELYENHYAHEDHQRLAQTLFAAKSFNWFASYDNVRPVKAIYEPQRSIAYSLSYSAGKSAKGEEILFFDSFLRIPAISSPLEV